MKTEKFYNLIAPFYPIINLFLKQNKNHLIKEINNLPEGSLLEIGVGFGDYLKHYKKKKITAIDSSSKMLNQAKKINCSTISFLKMNAEQLNFKSEMFDYIVCSHLLSVSSNPNKIVKEINKALRPNGKFLILNHQLPKSNSKVIYQLFNPIAKLFHFKSDFNLENITALQQFNLVKQTTFGWQNNYALTIYQKI